MGEYRRNFSSFLFFSTFSFFFFLLPSFWLFLFALYFLYCPLSDSSLVSVYSTLFYFILSHFYSFYPLPSLLFFALYLALSLSHTMWRCLSTSPPPNILLLIPLHYTVLGIIKFYMIVTLPLSLSISLLPFLCFTDLFWVDLTWPKLS